MNRPWRAPLALVRPLVVLGISAAAGVALLATTHRDGAGALIALFNGAFGSRDAVLGTLSDTTPLLLTGTAVWVALAAGWLTLGAEGQVSVGALAAAATGVAIPGYGGVAAALLASAVAGALWSVPAPWMRFRFGAHEVVTGLLLNFVARNGTRWLAAGPLRDPNGEAPRTATISTPLPTIVADSDLHLGLPVALLVSGFLLMATVRSILGYEARFAGASPRAALRAGIPVVGRRLAAFAVSGAACGLAGGIAVLGPTPFRGFPVDFHGIGYGFDGLVVGLLAGSSAFAVPWVALLLGALSNGAEAMAFDTGVPRQLAQVLIACLFLGIAAGRSRRGADR
ncbi:MAG: ABC transporter permease [Armatimonadota bacterium]